MSNLQTHYDFQLDFQKVDWPTGGKWIINRTKYHKGNQLQIPVENPCRESKHDIKESEGNMFNSKIMSRDRNILGSA